MDNASVCGELTCALGIGSRIYVGTAYGSVRAYAPIDGEERGQTQLNKSAAASTSGSGCEESDFPLARPLWTLRACVDAITSICGVEDRRSGELAALSSVLLVCGSATGELVVFRNELEVRRFQLESAVQHISHGQGGEFIVGDLMGTLYGVTQYEIQWKTRLPASNAQEDNNAACFYPASAQPVVQAIASVKLLDVEKTLSNYVLVGTGQKHLLVTHRGKEFGFVPANAPIKTLVSFAASGASADEEDVVLAAGEEGIIYRLVSYRDVTSKEMPDFRFTLEMWAQVSFPIVKLLPMVMPSPPTENKRSAFTWICLGVDGEVAVFRGQERVNRWDSTKGALDQGHELGFPVDMVVLSGGDDPERQTAAVVFPDRIRVFSIDPATQK